MKKAFDQTVRELKREVNKKVLKVPGVEQKILDATSNEPWGPHGSLLSDIAQASRNYHEYQIIMHVLWKRLNDTGKNWRHVYKALTVLEYLVGHGSERVIDEIKEHAYQISTLSDFQYIDSSGKDQGNNVRRKSQAVVSLVNDKEKIQEVRQKALANKDKYRATFSSSGSYKPSSFSSTSGYGDDDHYGRYGSRDDDRNDYGRERDLAYKDDDRYARGGDFYRDGDRYGRDSDEHYGRDSYKDDEYRGGRGNDDYQFGPRSRSFDKDRDHSYEDEDSYSSRNGGTRANDASPDGRQIERKLSEQSGAPPSYEAAVRNGHTDERDGGVGTATVPKSLSPAAPEASSPQSATHGPQHTAPSSALIKDDSSFDEFDPRGFMPAKSSLPPSANSALPSAGVSGVDLFGNPATLDPVNSFALVLATPTITSETELVKTSSDFGMNFVALSSASAALSQPAEDPFGDGPFKAILGENIPVQQQDSNSVVSAGALLPTTASSTAIPEPMTHVASKVETPFGFDFESSLGGLAYMPTVANGQQYAANLALMPSESPLAHTNKDDLGSHVGPINIQTTNTPFGHTSFPVSGLAAVSSQAAEPAASTYLQTTSPGFLPEQGPSVSQAVPLPMQSVQPVVQMNMPPAPVNHTQQFAQSPVNQQPSTAVSGPSNTKQSNDKFETKSSVWADTLNRGIVNLNISGPKTNPLADIGVDFDSINRMDRRKEKEKSAANSMTSTVTMGKAMGSGSGIARAGAGSLNPTARPTMGSGMGMGMGMGGSAVGLGMGMGGPSGMGAGMGGYGGAMNQPMGPGGGMAMNMGMGMGLGGSMRPPAGMQSPSPGLPGAGYNSVGMGGYGSQQQYGGGYR